MASPVPGTLLAERFELVAPLGGAADDGRVGQGQLWRGQDRLAGSAPVVLRCLRDPEARQRLRDLWPTLQGLLHPQIPRFGSLIEADDALWLVREWQEGRTYAEVLAARSERQLVFGAGEVLLLLRQFLPVLSVLHGQGLVHADLNPRNLLRRERDGLPVMLDVGLLRRAGSGGSVGATPGYAPAAQGRGEPMAAWMDLHALAVTALELLSGEPPQRLLDPATLTWRLPAALDAEPALRAVLQRMLQEDRNRRFHSAGQALDALQALPMPDSTGPVPRADRTVVLAPAAEAEIAEPAPSAAEVPAADEEPAAASAPVPVPGPARSQRRPRQRDREAAAEGRLWPVVIAPAAEAEIAEPTPSAAEVLAAAEEPAAASAPVPVPGPARSQRRPRQRDREAAAEGRLWPVVIALLLSAVVGTTLGWLLLGRDQPEARRAVREPEPEAATSLPPAEVEQRQQLLSRLRALRVDRPWFLSLVDAGLMERFPERQGRLPSDSLEDAPLRRAWNEQAEEWLARIELLPPSLRARLGRFSDSDWDRRRRDLAQQGLTAEALSQLISSSAAELLPGRSPDAVPGEPFRQLWYAAAEQRLANLQIERLAARSGVAQELSTPVEAGGARLVLITVPDQHRLVLGVNGSPLMQMTVFGADGTVVDGRGPLRIAELPAEAGSPVQLLITNEGVSSGLITLSCRADRVLPPVLVPGEDGPGDRPDGPPRGRGRGERREGDRDRREAGDSAPPETASPESAAPDIAGPDGAGAGPADGVDPEAAGEEPARPDF